MTSLLDILKEEEMRIGFTDCFKTQRSSERFDRDELQKRLLLALYGLGTNTGLKSISAGRHGVSYKELLHTRKFYIYKAALREAISKVGNAIFKISNPVIWGEGTTDCASDSKVWILGSESYDRMAYLLWRAWCHDILACRKKIPAFIPCLSAVHLQKLPV